MPNGTSGLLSLPSIAGSTLGDFGTGPDMISSGAELTVTNNPTFASPFTVGFGASRVSAEQDFTTQGAGTGTAGLTGRNRNTALLVGLAIAGLLTTAFIFRR